MRFAEAFESRSYLPLSTARSGQGEDAPINRLIYDMYSASVVCEAGKIAIGSAKARQKKAVSCFPFPR